MYFYIFEHSHSPKDLERSTQIREYISHLGIAGEMATLRNIDQAEGLVEQALSKRYSTIVAVGGLETINTVAKAVSAHNVVFGIIPLFQHPDITHLIGVSEWKDAAEHLKKRRWHQVGLGIMNGTEYFLTPATCVFSGNDALCIKTDDFSAEVAFGTMVVRLPGTENREGLYVEVINESRAPSLMSILVGTHKPEVVNTSMFNASWLQIESAVPLPLSVAGNVIAHTPVKITCNSQPIKLIVAKGFPPA